jgi:hypothetical protein
MKLKIDFSDAKIDKVSKGIDSASSELTYLQIELANPVVKSINPLSNSMPQASIRFRKCFYDVAKLFMTPQAVKLIFSNKS